MEGQGDYFTLIFLPARMLLPDMLLSLRSFLTVVWWRAAISDRVSPFLMVTLLLPPFLFFFFPLPFLLLLLLLLLDEEELLWRL